MNKIGMNRRRRRVRFRKIKPDLVLEILVSSSAS
jgi:Uma2 family endonuclease